MIKVNNLCLTIRKHRILEDISLTVETGTICGLIGRNGSGKTMLMKCISGYIRPTSGTIEINGQQLRSNTRFPESMGVIIETPGFIPYYSGYRNLSCLYNLNHKRNPQKIKATLEMVGLDPNSKLPVRKYSLGMRQRLGLAQAIIDNPMTLILDEPFNGLDWNGVKDMRNYLMHLKSEGKTILVSSHSTEDISILCDQVMEMGKN